MFAGPKGRFERARRGRCVDVLAALLEVSQPCSLGLSVGRSPAGRSLAVVSLDEVQLVQPEGFPILALLKQQKVRRQLVEPGARVAAS